MKSGCINCQIKSRAAKTLGKEELVFLEKNCAEIEYFPGERIMVQGKLSTHVAYVKEGLVKVHMKGPRNDQILKLAAAGTYVGIQTILAENTHQFSSTSLTLSRICHVDIRSFKELISRNREFAKEIIDYLCRDELNYFRRFVNQSQKQINGRLADTILYLADEIFNNESFELPLSRSDLGTLICTTRESTTRAIKELNELGAVEISGKNFRVRERQLLQRLSNSG